MAGPRKKGKARPPGQGRSAGKRHGGSSAGGAGSARAKAATGGRQGRARKGQRASKKKKKKGAGFPGGQPQDKTQQDETQGSAPKGKWAWKKKKKDLRAAREEEEGTAPNGKPTSEKAQHVKGEATDAVAKRLRRKRGQVNPNTVPAPRCRRRHTMIQRALNPVAYKQQACCDACGKTNLPQRHVDFFHCSFCRWDICMNCAKEMHRKGEAVKKQRLEWIKAAKEAKKAKRQETHEEAKKEEQEEQKDPDEPPKYNRSRREIWLPTDTTAVSRAPLKAEVLQAWQEGVPL